MTRHTPSPTANARDVTATHTPGPWICEHGADDFFFVAPVDGEFDRDQRDANARLIAAAPEMLEALECAVFSICARINGPDHTLGDEIALTKVRAAIAKATAS